MSVRTTIGQLMINDALPPELRDYKRRLDKGGIKKLLAQVADRYPDQYKEIAAKLMDIGQEVSHNEGSSITLKDLTTSDAKKIAIPLLKAEIDKIVSNNKYTDKQKEALVVKATSKLLGVLDEEVYREGKEKGNRLVDFADSGARGGKSNINQLLGAGLMVTNNVGKPIPIPIASNFSEGIDPAELWAASYGVRSGYIDIKQCLDKHTKVLMADGSTKEIYKIKAGDEVMGSNRKGELKPTKVLEVFNNGLRDCYRYVFNVNRARTRFIDVIATEDHKVLAKFKAGRSGAKSKYSVYEPTPIPLRKAANCKDSTHNPFVAEVPRGWDNSNGKVERDAIKNYPAGSHRNVECGFKSYSKEFLGPRHTYDLHVANTDHLFVLSNGLIVSNSTPKAGYFGKQLAQAAHKLIASDDKPLSGTGLPVETKDPENEGSVLAADYGKYKEGTILTPKIIKELNRKHKKILIHSPIASISTGRGIPRVAAGLREYGRLPNAGENIGIAAAQALCLDENTMVRLADGSSKAIKDIKPGDIVLGCSTAGVVKPVRVLAASYSGEKECIKYTFRSGTGKVAKENLLSVVATSEHKILSEIVVRTCKAAASRLKYFKPIDIRPLGTQVVNKCDRFCAKLSDSFDDTDMYYEPLALLLGLLTGDGSYTGKGYAQGVCFSCYDAKLIDDMRLSMKKMQLEIKERSSCEYQVIDLTASTVKYTADNSIYSSRVIQRLKDEDMWGHRSYEKLLPKTIWQWDNESVADYISGVLATDGWVSKKHHVGFCSTSYKLIEGIKYLLSIRFGIQGSSICKNIKKKENGKYHRPCYKFQVSAVDAVSRLADILKVPGVKEGRLQAIRDRKVKGTPRVQGRCSLVSEQPVGARRTYDIYIEHTDHLFLLDNGLVVSNSEPLSQSSISSKHTAGVVGASGGGSSAETQAGFDVVNRMANIPKHYPEKATVVSTDGTVGQILDAPQGGKYVYVNNEKFFVPPELKLTVRTGDKMEAGDALSTGLPSPAEVVKYKGIGEGRRYFLEKFYEVLNNSGVKTKRRNAELLTRALINHVRVGDKGINGSLPGDLIEYDEFAARYVPREDSELTPLKRARNKYLEQPTLHYSIGTRITPRVVKTLKDFGVDSVMANDKEPDFEPEMQRAMDTLSADQDWQVRLGGFNLQKNMLDAVHRGSKSELHGQSFIPSLAKGTEFGRSKTTPY